ncbi:MAG: DegT/DnrJ/EryC1/StrS aminotransferase family protein, partial [Candidatus Omnitrophota bacterium]
YKNEKAGTIGDLGAFSFFPSKNLGCWGDGGLIATSDQRLFDLIKVLRDHGQVSRYNAKYIGYNALLDSIQAAVLLAKLKYLEKFNSLRRKLAKQYNKALNGLEGITVPLEPKSYQHVYHQYTIKVSKKRDELLKFLNSNGVASRIYYPLPLHKMVAFKKGKVKSSLKNTMDVSSRILSLPIHPFLKDSEIRYVTGIIYKFFSKSAAKVRGG